MISDRTTCGAKILERRVIRNKWIRGKKATFFDNGQTCLEAVCYTKITDRWTLGSPIQMNGAFYSIKKSHVINTDRQSETIVSPHLLPFYQIYLRSIYILHNPEELSQTQRQTWHSVVSLQSVCDWQTEAWFRNGKCLAIYGCQQGLMQTSFVQRGLITH